MTTISHPDPERQQPNVKSLTRNQKALINDLLVKYPHITPASVQYYYDHYNYARNWFVCIEIHPEAYPRFQTITRCDHSHTAQAKVKEIRAYIAAASSTPDGESGGAE